MLVPRPAMVRGGHSIGANAHQLAQSHVGEHSAGRATQIHGRPRTAGLHAHHVHSHRSQCLPNLRSRLHSHVGALRRLHVHGCLGSRWHAGTQSFLTFY